MQLNAVNTKDATEEHVSMGTLKLLGTMKEDLKEKRSLKYVKAKVNDKDVLMMVDTDETHTFIRKKEADRLGLSVTKAKSSLKTVNS